MLEAELPLSVEVCFKIVFCCSGKPSSSAFPSPWQQSDCPFSNHTVAHGNIVTCLPLRVSLPQLVCQTQADIFLHPGRHPDTHPCKHIKMFVRACVFECMRSVYACTTLPAVLFGAVRHAHCSAKLTGSGKARPDVTA